MNIFDVDFFKHIDIYLYLYFIYYNTHLICKLNDYTIVDIIKNTIY